MNCKPKQSFHDVRSAMRFPTSFPAILRWDADFAFVRIADIADSGVRLLGRHLPPFGADIRIGAKALNERGRVIWRSEHSCGVILQHRIHALGIVRANCFPVRPGKDLQWPLDHIRKDALADVLVDVFASNETANTFLRAKVSH